MSAQHPVPCWLLAKYSWCPVGTVTVSNMQTQAQKGQPGLQVVVGPKALMHPDVEEALPGTTYNALTRRAGLLVDSKTVQMLLCCHAAQSLLSSSYDAAGCPAFKCSVQMRNIAGASHAH